MSSLPDSLTARTDETIDAVTRTVAETTSDVREAIAREREHVGASNPTGDEQLAADLAADELFAERVLAIDGVASYASEEREGLLESTGRYHVAMDPLDGSSNLEPNGGMGTIFGVYESRPPTTGRDLVAAGFVIYGPATTMVVATGDRVREYVVDDGSLRVVDDDVRLPGEATVYGFGGGDDDWPAPFREFAARAREELKLRYGGAMIADVNKVLTYGGVFAYPALLSRPEGKLRVQFEGHPMGYVIEAAGGRSSDGETSLLDVVPDGLHDRSPLHLGSPAWIDRLESALD